MSGIKSIRPDWQVPTHVHALVTLRSGGVSRGVYQSLNLATHVGDDVTLIAGAELGGVALAAATSMVSGKNWIIVRNSKKGYGTGKMVEGVLKAGDVVLLVEDIATTGGQVLEAAKIITEAGATVKSIICVIDRKQGAEENITGAGFTFESIMTKDDLGIKD